VVNSCVSEEEPDLGKVTWRCEEGRIVPGVPYAMLPIAGLYKKPVSSVAISDSSGKIRNFLFKILTVLIFYSIGVPKSPYKAWSLAR
jgi:hypothetical protein